MGETLRLLLRHMSWADARTAASIRALEEPSDDAIRIFAHVATAEWVHLARMRGEDPFPQDFWPGRSLEESADLAVRAEEDWSDFLDRLDESALERPVGYRNSEGRYFETAPAAMLFHLSLHGEHHRGQIARLVRDRGGEPAMTDLLQFLREGQDRR